MKPYTPLPISKIPVADLRSNVWCQSKDDNKATLSKQGSAILFSYAEKAILDILKPETSTPTRPNTPTHPPMDLSALSPVRNAQGDELSGISRLDSTRKSIPIEPSDSEPPTVPDQSVQAPVPVPMVLPEHVKVDSTKSNPDYQPNVPETVPEQQESSQNPHQTDPPEPNHADPNSRILQPAVSENNPDTTIPITTNPKTPPLDQNLFQPNLPLQEISPTPHLHQNNTSDEDEDLSQREDQITVNVSTGSDNSIPSSSEANSSSTNEGDDTTELLHEEPGGIQFDSLQSLKPTAVIAPRAKTPSHNPNHAFQLNTPAPVQYTINGIVVTPDPWTGTDSQFGSYIEAELGLTPGSFTNT